MENTAAAVLRLFPLFEGSAIGISLADLNARNLRVNDRYAEITGYSPEELLSLTFMSYTHPDDLVDNLAFAHRMNRGEYRRAVFEKRYIRKSGEVCWVRNSITMIPQGGKPAYALVLSEDISEQRSAGEELLKTRDILRKLSHSIGDMPSPSSRNDAPEAGRTSRAFVSTLARLRAATDQALDAAGLCEEADSPHEVSGLKGALTRNLHHFTSCTGMLVTLNVETGAQGLTLQTNLSAVRVVNLLLSNAFRFSGSEAADVSVARKGASLVIDVSDSGRKSRLLIVSKTQAQALDRQVAGFGGTFELSNEIRGTVRRAVLPIV